KNYTDPEHNCYVYKFELDGKKIIVIDVPEYKEIPIICKKMGHKSDNKTILNEGQIYIRTDSGESRTASTSSEVMREFLTRAISKKSDDLLNNIKILLKGQTKEIIEESEN